MEHNYLDEIYTRIPELQSNPESWKNVNRLIVRKFNAVAGELYSYNAKSMVKVQFVAEGVPHNFRNKNYYETEKTQQANNHYLHTVYKPNKTGIPPNQALHDATLTTGSYPPSSKSIPFGWRYWANLTFCRRGTIEFNYRLSRTVQQGRFRQDEIAEFEKCLKPLALAFELYLNFDNIRLRTLWDENTLNLINTATIILNEKQDVDFFNLAAKNVLDQNDGLSINNNRLQLYSTAMTKKLSKTVEEVLRFDPQVNKSSHQPLNADHLLFAPRPSAKPPYKIQLSAITTRPALLGMNYQYVVMLITDPVEATKPSDAYLMEVFRLTKCEIEVVNLLMQGMDSNDIACGLGKKVSTVRQYVKSIIKKTGCNRQAKLVLLLNNLA